MGFGLLMFGFKHETGSEILNAKYEGVFACLFFCKKTQYMFAFFWYIYFRLIQAVMTSSVDYHFGLEFGLLS